MGGRSNGVMDGSRARMAGKGGSRYDDYAHFESLQHTAIADWEGRTVQMARLKRPGN